VITTVLPEHPRELGPSISDIAWHKAGIIPAGGTVVVGRLPAEAAEVVAAEAAARGARVLWLGADIAVERSAGGLVEVSTPLARYGSLRPSLSGDYQADNAALAIAAVEAALGSPPDETMVRRGLARVQNPGRFTVADRGARILVDATVERPSAVSVREWLRTAPRPRRLVVAVPADKDPGGVLDELVPEAETVYLARAANPRLRFEDDVEDALAASRGIVTPRFADGRAAVAALRSDSGSTAFVGTLSFVAEVLDALEVHFAAAWTP
jgi:dihydrofolate synthase/folylpolyglutamate synthase